MRNENTYTISIDLNISYRQPRCSIDRKDAEEELTDLISEHQETIANLIADLIDQDVEVDQVETARYQGTMVMV